MLVPVAVVCCVPVPFVHIVDVVTVLNGLVVAIRPMITAVVAFVYDVLTAGLALVPVAVVLAVGMAVVQVVDVIVVTYLDVSAIRTVPMFVILMGVVLRGSHDRLLFWGPLWVYPSAGRATRHTSVTGETRRGAPRM